MRKITKIIIHCSATKAGKDFRLKDIAKWHQERNFPLSGGTYCGYHYVIDLSEIRTGISTIAADDADNDSDWWTLQGFKIGRKPTQPGVYIHHGKQVVIKLKK